MKRTVIAFFAGAAVTAGILYGTVVPNIRSHADSVAQHQSAAYQSQIRDQSQIQSSTDRKVSWWSKAPAKSGCPTCKASVSGDARLLD
jgi:hypothetical protein